MTTEELNKLKEDLLASRKLKIDQLKAIASENPLVKGDFDVVVEDLGDSSDDASQELSELDRNQPLVDQLEREIKEIDATLRKIESGEYGKCQNCLAEIGPLRLKAIPIAAFCINCAKIIK